MVAELKLSAFAQGGRTLRAIAAATADDPDAIIRPLELVELAYAPGVRPSLACRRLMLLLLAEPGSTIIDAVTHRIERRRLPAGHRSVEDFQRLVQEVRAVSLVQTSRSARGRKAIRTAGIFEWISQEVDQAGTAWIEWRLTPVARAWFAESQVYARLSRAALLRLQSAYSVELYQWAALLSGCDHPRWTGSVAELLTLLGAPETLPWRDLRRRALDVAARELQVAGYELLVEVTRRRGRAVQALCLHFRAVRRGLHRRSSRTSVAPRQQAIELLLGMEMYERHRWHRLARERGAPAGISAAAEASLIAQWAGWVEKDLCAQAATKGQK